MSGFVLFPILIPNLYQFIKNRDYIYKKNITIISITLLIPVAWSMQKFPIGNYLYNTGIGPETLFDTYIAHINNYHSYSSVFYIIKFISYLGSFSLILILVEYILGFFEKRKNIKSIHFTIFTIFISLFVYYSFLAKASPIFDRYINVFSIFIIPLIIYSNIKILKNLFVFIFLTIALWLFSVFATKDYFSGHKTRNIAINYLSKLNVPDSQINGGLEFEATTFYKQNDWILKWENTPEHYYVLSYGNIKNYNKLMHFSFQRFIPYKTDTVFILKRNNVN